MRFASRLVLGTFSIVALAVVIALGGRERGVPGLVLVALPVAFALAWIAGRSIARPLVELSDTARDIAAGKTPHFPRSSIPEVEALVEAMRRMHGDLIARALELEQERAGGNAIVDAMVEGVIAADPRGKIMMANPAARRLLGYAPDASLPDLRTLFRVKSARDAVVDVLAGREVHDCEVQLDDRTLSLNARPLHRNGAVLVLHDLTDLRRLEAVRRDFVANVSHELKTPLTSIAGYAETLTDPGLDAETRRRFVETVMSNARRMQRLVDDLLDLSRIESGHWTPRVQHTALEPVVSEAWDGFRDRAAKRQVEFVREIAPDAVHLDVDADALRQVLSNLFDNALRYAPMGGRILCRAEHVDGGVAVSVTDNGGGISGEHLPRIFERFYRVDPARSRDEGGTGLGLSIVRHMVEAHGGRVDAESEFQRGMTVRCWFPDQVADAPPQAEPVARAS